MLVEDEIVVGLITVPAGRRITPRRISGAGEIVAGAVKDDDEVTEKAGVLIVTK